MPKTEDLLCASLDNQLASSHNWNEWEDLSTIISADTEQKLNECLRLYNYGIPSLAWNTEQFDQLGALLIDLAD